MVDLAAVLIALLPVGGTVLGLYLGNKHASEQAAKSRQFELERADSERLANRRADAYLEMILTVKDWDEWAHGLAPFVTKGAAKHPGPSTDRQLRTEALVAAYGSAEVRKLFAAFRLTLRPVAMSVVEFRRGGAGSTERHEQLHQSELPAMRAARELLEDQVRRELGVSDDAVSPQSVRSESAEGS